MGYEIDFLPVGDESRSGDAIALRFGNLYGGRDEQAVVVIDGGFRDTGTALVEHIRNYYGTDRVDLVVSTHPDSDHVRGLEVVVEELDVRELWMHRPWMHGEVTEGLFRDGRVTPNSVNERLEKALNRAMTLERLAMLRGIPIREPFAGVSQFNDKLVVLGPTQSYYQSLLGDFRSTPAAALIKEAFEAVVGGAVA